MYLVFSSGFTNGLLSVEGSGGSSAPSHCRGHSLILEIVYTVANPGGQAGPLLPGNAEAHREKAEPVAAPAGAFTEGFCCKPKDGRCVLAPGLPSRRGCP